MSELLEKLKRRRDVVDTGGLHFENVTQQSQCTASATTPQYSHQGPQIPSGGCHDLKEALNRRRAQVDNAGAHWESTPESTHADATNERRKSEMNFAGRARTSSSTDFRERIEQQRARVDTTSRTWQNAPSETSADCTSAAASPAGPRPPPPPRRMGSGLTSPGSRSAAETPAQTPVRELSLEDEAPATPAPTPAEAQTPGAAPEAPEAPAAAPAAAEAAEPQEEAQAPAAAAPEAPATPPATPAREEAPLSPAGAEDEDEDQMIAAHTEAPQEALAAAEDNPPSPEKKKRLAPDQVIRRKGKRITWLVELEPGASSFESPAFSIESYSEVMLFAGKGWGQRHINLHAWPDGQDHMQQFDVQLAGREMLLCGLVFQL